MFNIGGGEFLVIALIALIVLGPQRLPEAARQVGKVMGDLRKLSSGFQNELKGALQEADAARPTAPARDVLGTTTSAPAEPEAPSAASSAVRSVSTPRPQRRTPLQAAPAPKASRPRSKGS